MKKYTLAVVLALALIVPSLVSADYVYYTSSAAAAAGAASNSTTATATATPFASGSSCVNLPQNLRYLDTDSTTAGGVTLLQGFLYANGYLKVAPTGYFGGLTKTAVTAFQNQYGLVPNPPAFVGSQTRAKIQQVSCNGTGAAISNATASGTISQGCVAGDVYDIHTGQPCSSSFTQTSSSNDGSVQASDTVQNAIAPPTVLPYINLLTVIPTTSTASTSREVSINWAALAPIDVINIALSNDATKALIDIVSSSTNDGSETFTLSSANIPDGSYAMAIYWPSNSLAGAASPAGTVVVSGGLITVNLYPSVDQAGSANGGTLAPDNTSAAYSADIAAAQQEVQKDKQAVKKADTAAKKQSALQKMCAGYKFLLDPADCSFIKLTGI